MRYVFKLAVLFLISLGLFKVLYLDELQKYSGASAIIQKVHSEPNYKYWTYEKSAHYCGETSVFASEIKPEVQPKVEELLDKFTQNRAKVVYFNDTDILGCLKNIPNIAIEFHKRNLEIAFNLEREFEYQKLYSSDLSKFDVSNYTQKFKDAGIVNEWLDYIVIDNAMEFMTYSERSQLALVLRTIFPRQYIGFRFTRHYYFDPGVAHPNRRDKKIEDFLPRDDDGDFILAAFEVSDFKRTMVFNEDPMLDNFRVQGEFLR